MEKKIIAVVGATGAQGGGLVRAIMNDKNSDFTARALTRNPESEKAKALADLGAEVVKADLNDSDSLQTAFEGAYGAYCVTFFWEHFSPEKELIHAKAMAQAAKKAELEHVIWSTLEDTRKWVPLTDSRMPTLMDKYKVPHFDAKAEADAFFTELDMPVTLLRTSFYWDNMIYFGLGPQRREDGNLYLTLPMADKKLPGMAAEDIGKCAYGIFKEGKKFIGQNVAITSEHLTGSHMASSLSKALGEKVQYQSIEPDDFRNMGFPGADDLGNMFQFKRDFEAAFTAPRDPATSRSLNSELLSFDQWLEQHKNQIPIN